VPTEDGRLVFTLRRLTEGDWALWRDVRLRALAEAPYAFGSTLGYWQGEGDRERRWRSRLADVPFNIVAVAGNSLIGQVSGDAADSVARVELISMWVDPAARGAGVGAALVAEVVEWARVTGAAAVVLSVKRTNEHAASLYRRMGFAPTGERADEGEARMQLTFE
jgi:ribosomal protein S18 acetylase RimI-like enzyme